MKKTLSSILAVLLIACILLLPGCGKAKDGEITDSVLEKFMELTQIPRPSTHEAQVSDFLEQWAKDHDFQTVRDDYSNLVIEVPATKGMEDKPLVALQGHMDMVFVQADGLSLDPLTTTIHAVNDGTVLSSDGTTSLGGDDGIGIAIMECVAEGKMDHGSLRLIITTDEEQGMTGAQNIDKSCIADVKYMINLDDEIEGEVVISSAAAVTCDFTRDLTAVPPSGDLGVTVSVSKCAGGHSGDEIDKGRCNAILALGELLCGIEERGLPFELAEISGGNAKNAIPTGAQATICIPAEGLDAVNDACQRTFDQLKSRFEETEPDMTLEIAAADAPETVVSQEDKTSILTFFKGKTDGVYTMSETVDGLIESSTNLGVIEMDTGHFMAEAMMRSSSPEKQEELIALDEALASEADLQGSFEAIIGAWPAKADNHLQMLAEEVYADLFSKELEVVAIHAGLECGAFAAANPEMDIISLGPNITSPHTIHESIVIESIGNVWKLLEGILAGV